MRIIRTIIFCTCVVVSLTGTAFSVYRNKNINIAYETHKPLPIEVSQNLLDIRPEPLALELPAQEASLSHLPKLAAVHFLTKENGLNFGSGGLEFSDNTAEQCKELGYTVTSCPGGTLIDACPYNSSYYKTCCGSEYKYTASNCSLLNTTSESCGGKYKDCDCNATMYPVTSCTSPQVVATGSGSSCTADGITRYSECVCPSSYSETCTGQNMQGKGTGCTKNGTTKYTACECKAGYNLTCSGSGGSPARPTDYCLKDGIKYYNSCNTCAFRCSIAEADKQPGIVYEYEECSKKYCDIGCATGYIDWCEKPETDCAKLGYTKSASQCANGYLKCPYNSAAVFCEDEVVEACTVANCTTCVSGDKTKCATCNTGYTLSNGTCNKDDLITCTVKNCTTCVSGNSAQCSICASGYISQDGLCVSALLPTEPIDGCPLNTTPQTCNGQEYCCPAGVSCLSSSGSIRCYMKNPDVGGGLL